jgi:hypothetical protein
MALVSVFLFPYLLGHSIQAEEGSTKTFDLRGEATYEMGKIVEGRYHQNLVDDLWLGSMTTRLGADITMNEHVSIVLLPEGRLWFNTVPQESVPDVRHGIGPYYSFYIHEAKGRVSLLDTGPMKLGFELGQFEYKYNPEVFALGEYLFRTGTYPAYIVNVFGKPYERLSGLRFKFEHETETGRLKVEQLITAERIMRPYHDLSLTTVASYKFMDMVEIGAGVSFAHAIPMDKELTQPRVRSTVYQMDTLGISDVDSVFDFTGGFARLDTSYSVDSSFYTFQGTKLMGRVTVDPLGRSRGASGLSGIFGPQGGKLYVEAAVIGLKNYPSNPQNPYGYDKLMEKLPVMFGITLPTWKVLDVLALEFEYFKAPYPNSFESRRDFGTPLPSTDDALFIPELDTLIDGSIVPIAQRSTYLTDDTWKWAVVGSKTFFNTWQILFQLSRDHQRWEVDGAFYNEMDWETIMVKKGHWSWHLKSLFIF